MREGGERVEELGVIPSLPRSHQEASSKSDAGLPREIYRNLHDVCLCVCASLLSTSRPTQTGRQTGNGQGMAKQHIFSLQSDRLVVLVASYREGHKKHAHTESKPKSSSIIAASLPKLQACQPPLKLTWLSRSEIVC